MGGYEEVHPPVQFVDHESVQSDGGGVGGSERGVSLGQRVGHGLCEGWIGQQVHQGRLGDVADERYSGRRAGVGAGGTGIGRRALRQTTGTQGDCDNTHTETRLICVWHLWQYT